MRVDLRGQDGTGLDPDHAVGHGGEGLVVGDDDDGPAGMAAGVLQQLQHTFAGFVIQGAGRLVTQQDLGVLSQGPGDGHPLLFPARKLSGEIAHPLF